MKTLAQHLLIELFDCNYNAINDVKKVEKVMVEAANIAKATIVKVMFHKFEPLGVSGVVVIAESHFSIHTWPEYKYAAVDLFGCGEKILFDKAIEYIIKNFKPKKVTQLEVKRGIILND
ncbi:MAG: adenosylmethionine decarboxylase [bacterium]